MAGAVTERGSAWLSLGARQVRLKLTRARRRTRDASACRIDRCFNTAKSDSAAGQLDVRPIPAPVGHAQNAEVIVSKSGDPAAKGNPVAASRWVGEIPVIDFHVDCAPVRVERSQSMGAAAAISHQNRFLLRRAICAYHVNSESSSAGGVEHLRHFALYVGIHR